MESNSVCNDTSDWHNRTTLSITSMITDRIGRLEVLLPIDHNRHNFRKQQIHFGKIYQVETKPEVRKFSILETPRFF